MKKDLDLRRPSGSEKNEPKVMSEVFNEYLLSDEPLALAFRNWSAKREHGSKKDVNIDVTDRLFKDYFPNTEVGIDLKLITRDPSRMNVGESLAGLITHDAQDHFCFIENGIAKKNVVATRRSSHVYEGKCVNVNRKSDGTLHPTFNRPRYTENFTFQDFCREAAEELLAVAGLIEKW